MTAMRMAGIDRGPSFEIEVDGKKVLAYEGETLATALMAAGIQAFSVHTGPYPVKRLYCGMGTCQQCLVTVNGQSNTQACRTLAVPGMKVGTQT